MPSGLGGGAVVTSLGVSADEVGVRGGFREPVAEPAAEGDGFLITVFALLRIADAEMQGAEAVTCP